MHEKKDLSVLTIPIPYITTNINFLVRVGIFVVETADKVSFNLAPLLQLNSCKPV